MDPVGELELLRFQVRETAAQLQAVAALESDPGELKEAIGLAVTSLREITEETAP